MADAEREARINLKTTADNSGAQETAKGLGDVEKAQKSLDTASRESQKQTDELTKSKRGLREAMKGVAVELPGVARLVNLLTNPLSALGVVLGSVAGAFLSWKASIDEVGRKASTFQTINDEIDALEQNLAKFRDEASQSGDGFGSIGTGSQEAATGVKRLNDEIERNRQLQDELANKGLALTKARIRARVESGELTKVQGLEAEIAAEDQVRRDQARREVEVGETKLKNLKDTLAALPEFTAEDLAQMKQDADLSALRAGKAGKKFESVRDRNAALMHELGQDVGVVSGLGEAFGMGSLREGVAVRTINRLGNEVEQARATMRREQLGAGMAARRFESAQDTVRTRRGLIADINVAENNLGARRSFLDQAVELDSATAQAGLQAARTREHRDAARAQAQADQRAAASVNAALREEAKRRGISDMMDQLLELMRTHNTTLESHKQKILEIDRRGKDARID